jgi:RNA polymerase sigma factor (sigma-70 family)
MASLSPAYRAILALKYEADLDYLQIAETLGLSVANVEKRLYRARQALLEKMKD